MRRSPLSYRPAAAVLALFTPAALAQSINIDFGDAFARPTAAYGAAGVAGIWNSADFEILAPSFLVDVQGVPCDCWIYSEHGPRASGSQPDPLTSGDDEALLDDGLWGTGDVLVPITLLYLDPGRYAVIVYGLTGGQPAQRTFVEVSNPSNGRSVASTVGGPWTGSFDEGVTHARFGITVPDGRLDVMVAGGIWGQSGFSNGLQLIKVCDADFTSGAVPGQPGYGVPDGSLNNDDFFYFLARFADGDRGEADLTASAVAGSPGYGLPNGAVTNDDFFYYLSLFAAGC